MRRVVSMLADGGLNVPSGSRTYAAEGRSRARNASTISDSESQNKNEASVKVLADHPVVRLHAALDADGGMNARPRGRLRGRAFAAVPRGATGGGYDCSGGKACSPGRADRASDSTHCECRYPIKAYGFGNDQLFKQDRGICAAA